MEEMGFEEGQEEIIINKILIYVPRPPRAIAARKVRARIDMKAVTM